MKTNETNRNYNPTFSNESRQKKDIIIKALVCSIAIFIALLLISEMA